MTQERFRITNGKGFQIRFKNGYTVSVQFGVRNYCDNLGLQEPQDPTDCLRYDLDPQKYAGACGSYTAETALIGPYGLVDYEGDEVQRYRTPQQVLELLVYASNLDSEE